MGFRVIAVDTGDDKKALMQKYGVHRWIDFRIEKVSFPQVRTADLIWLTSVGYPKRSENSGQRSTHQSCDRHRWLDWAISAGTSSSYPVKPAERHLIRL